METPTLLSSVSERGVATLTFNRPEVENACDRAMLRALWDCVGTFRADGKVRILVLRGAGKHFCTGADMREERTGDGAQAAVTFPQVIDAIDWFSRPTIAIVQGAAIGGGAGLAAACDATIVDEQAYFSVPEVRFGTVPDGIARVLIRAIGARNFRRYALSGERIDAREAQRMGLAQTVVKDVLHDRAVEELIDSLLLGAPHAQAETKRLAMERPDPAGLDGPDEEPARKEAILAERREGAAAFRERRKPSWYS
jgi:methylglutaconyl-CoA hydratase